MKLHTERKFSAAHKLPYYKGACHNLHGHEWLVKVDIEGEKDTETDMLIDFKKIKQIIDKYDHGYLNDFFDNPTAENIAEQISLNLIVLANNIKIVTVQVYESENSYIEVTRILK